MNIKENENIKIKVASPENAAELLEIYKFYVENTAISFEIEPPTLQEFRARIEKTLKKYPYLIAVSPEDEQQRIREWKSKHLCKLSTANDFIIKYDGEDYTAVDVSAYEVFMIDNHSLPLTDCISVRSLLSRVNFSNFDIDSFLENQAGFLLEYVN